MNSPLSWGASILATVFTAAFFVILAVVLTHSDQIKENQILLVLLGTLTAGMLQILNYFFGSSAGSKDKDLRFDTMAANAIAKPNPSAATVDLVRAASGKKK
jgi:hypothetical protein